jgi:TolB protein
MKSLLTFILCSLLTSAFSQNTGIGIFQGNSDIGNPKIAGSAIYNQQDQSYSLKGGGYNIWFERDEFHYLYNKIKGDFILTANFEFTGKGANVHRKAGWMIRETTDEKSVHISATLHGNGLTVLQWRGVAGAAMRDPQDEIFAPDSSYNVIQIERAGKKITMRAARSGKPFDIIGSHEMENMPDEILAGLFVCSHDPNIIEEAEVWNVRIDKPVGDGPSTAGAAPAGCRLETITIADGKRKVIYEKQGTFEAPNWMPDGKKLLFNMAGSLFTIPVEGGATEKLNTGSVNRLNNDHGISFNGKLLAISSSVPGSPGGSGVYILPLTGGEPTLITPNTPSYWHGWAPNNEEVVYVARRDGKTEYNIYRNSIKGGKEVALTNIDKGQHVDGCEYSPDGKYIYFNGNLNGTMQIWRMKPDGSGMEQLTFDKYQNWFPHVSPDGKWIVLISFPPEIDPNSHPSYKRVMLRIMPTSGGTPKVLAFLYGGQGTINVPSWSPDSKQIAFVSNSGKE